MLSNNLLSFLALGSSLLHGSVSAGSSGGSAWPTPAASFPDTPFTASGRDIISASGKKITYAGVNWPGAADTMLPEGLQYLSANEIAARIASLGMNVVRLTYAIEMVDDIYSNSPNQTLKGTLVNALGAENGTKILGQILEKNPQFSEETTRLEVFDAVSEALAQHHIWTHLDNHVSKAIWCCDTADGNSWFGDEYFNVFRWQRGLGYMANHAKKWRGLASMSLRNELRHSDLTAQPYTWNDWMTNVIPAATGIHDNNTLPLIFFSGFGFDTDDSYFIQAQTWNDVTFTPSAYPFDHKIVYEIHNYDNGATSCSDMASSLYYYAYCAMNVTDTSCPNHAPMVMTEFGFNIEDGSWESVYAQCIRSTLQNQPGYPGGWMQWVVSGSYYIRQGIQDFDETWGLFNHDWSAWRNETVIEQFVKPFVSSTLNP